HLCRRYDFWSNGRICPAVRKIRQPLDVFTGSSRQINELGKFALYWPQNSKSCAARQPFIRDHRVGAIPRTNRPDNRVQWTQYTLCTTRRIVSIIICDAFNTPPLCIRKIYIVNLLRSCTSCPSFRIQGRELCQRRHFPPLRN